MTPNGIDYSFLSLFLHIYTMQAQRHRQRQSSHVKQDDIDSQ